MTLHSDKASEGNPELEGWATIREPGSVLLTILCLPVRLLGCILGFFLWSIVPGPSFDEFWVGLSLLLAVGLILIFVWPVHQGVHAVCAVYMDSPDLASIDIRPASLRTYHEIPLSRNRFLFMLMGPFVVLSLLPLIFIVLVFVLVPWYPFLDALTFVLGSLFLINGFISSDDFIEFVLVLFQIPSTAVVRKFNERTFWRERSPVGMGSAGEECFEKRSDLFPK